MIWFPSSRKPYVLFLAFYIILVSVRPVAMVAVTNCILHHRPWVFT